jgi:hypothetical protein
MGRGYSSILAHHPPFYTRPFLPSASPLLRSSASPLLHSSAAPLLRSSAPPLLCPFAICCPKFVSLRLPAASSRFTNGHRSMYRLTNPCLCNFRPPPPTPNSAFPNSFLESLISSGLSHLSRPLFSSPLLKTTK